MEETKKLKLDGKHFSKVLEDYVESLKRQLNVLAQSKKRMRTNPLLTLWKSKRLTKEYILLEMPRLQNKTSKLPSSERAVLHDIISTCIKKTALEEAKAVKEQLDKEAESDAEKE
jgi:hypothetical protein